MTCPRCGAASTSSAQFCDRCGGWFGLPRPVDGDASTGPGQAAPRRRPPGVVVGVVALAVVLAGLGAFGGVWFVLGRQPADAQQARDEEDDVDVGPTPSTSESPNGETDFRELYREVSSGVVQIEVRTCTSEGAGTGFLIAPDRVATAAHVVDGASEISVVVDGLRTEAEVLGVDVGTDVALLRTADPIEGHVFELEGRAAEVGEEVGAVGYPLGGPVSLTLGVVSGLGRDLSGDGFALEDLVQTDAAINPGNSGGPLLAADGTLLGLVEARVEESQGLGFAVSAGQAVPLLEGWRQQTVPLALQVCAPVAAPRPRQPARVDAPTAEPQPEYDDEYEEEYEEDYYYDEGVPDDAGGHPHEPALLYTLDLWRQGINSGDYRSAYAQFGPALRADVSYEEFSSGNASSVVSDVAILSIVEVGDGVDEVVVSFRSVQAAAAGRGGSTCSDWTIEYVMRESGGNWLMDGARNVGGSPTPC